ncbi:MAG: PAS domain S-box protein, partial [Vicinamibacterales bacterium]
MKSEDDLGTVRAAPDLDLEHFYAAMGSLADGIALIDAGSLRCLYVNDTASRMLAGQATGFADSMRPWCDDAVAISPAALVETREVRAENGTRRWLEISRRAAMAAGRWLITATIRDVTRQKAQNSRLEQYRAALDQTGDAILLIDAGRLEYVDVNEAAARMFGMTQEALLAFGPIKLRAQAEDFAPGENVADILRARYDELIAIYPQAAVARVVIRKAGGEVITVEATRRAFQSEGEWLVVTVLRDISERAEAQKRLRVLDAAVNQAADAIIVVDPQALTYIDVNEAAAHMMGVGREEMMRLGPIGFGESMSLRANPSDLKAMYATVVSRHPETVVEFRRVRTRDGRDLVLEGTRRAVRVDDAWLIVSVIRDVTERHNATRQLELFRQALDHSIDAINIVDRETMRILDTNQRSLDWSGLTREQYLAQEPHLRAGRGATRESVAAAYDEVIAMSPKPRVSICEQTRRDGTTFPAERVRTAVRLDGRWIILVSTRDITERMEAQRKLQLLGAAINEAVDAIHVVDVQTMTYADANQAVLRIFGLPRDEMVALGPIGMARRIEGMTEEAVRDRYLEAIARSPDSIGGIRDFRAADGTLRTIEFTRRALRADDRWLVVTVARDVTERMAGQRRLAQLEAAIDQAADAILVVDPETLAYLHINKACEQLLGLSRERMEQLGVGGVVRELGLGSPEEARRTYRELID